MKTMLRIKDYLDYKSIPIAVFERAIGMSNNSFGKTLKAGGSVGLDKLEKILSVYPDLSAEWLLRGTGDMLLSDSPAANIDNKYFQICQKLLETRQKENDIFAEISKLIIK